MVVPQIQNSKIQGSTQSAASVFKTEKTGKAASFSFADLVKGLVNSLHHTASNATKSVDTTKKNISEKSFSLSSSSSIKLPQNTQTTKKTIPVDRAPAQDKKEKALSTLLQEDASFVTNFSPGIKQTQTLQKVEHKNEKETISVTGEQKKGKNLELSKSLSSAMLSSEKQIFSAGSSVKTKEIKIDENKKEDQKEQNGQINKQSNEKKKTNVQVNDIRPRVVQSAQTKDPAVSSDQNKKNEANMLVSLSSHEQMQSSKTTETSKSSGTTASHSFQNLLAQELQGPVGTDIVQHASVILKDAGEGLIRLSLKPESLGNVKIRLTMSDNEVTGKIMVESEEAFKAFEQEIANLEQAFKEEGFSNASLELSYTGNGGNFSQKDGTSDGFSFSNYYSAMHYDANPGTESNGAGEDFDALPFVSINMLA